MQHQKSDPSKRRELRGHGIPSEPSTDGGPEWDLSVQAHCRRVATLALEIAGALPEAAGAKDALAQAALLHHASPLLFEQLAMDRLIEDILPGVAFKTVSAREAEPKLRPSDVCGMLSILEAFRRFPAERAQDPRVRTLAEVLVIGNLLDEELELLGWLPASDLEFLRTMEELAALFQPAVVAAVRKVLPGISSSARRRHRLAHHPVAEEAVRLYLEKRLTSSKAILSLLARDPALGALFLQAAARQHEGAGKQPEANGAQAEVPRPRFHPFAQPWRTSESKPAGRFFSR
jgi:hypothetical protein